MKVISNPLSENYSADPKNGFFSLFVLARTYVENEAKIYPTPPQYQVDLRLFSLSADVTIGALDKGQVPQLAWPRYDEVLVTWNPFLGRIKANVVASHTIDSSLLGSGATPNTGSIGKLKEQFKVYFDTLRNNKTVSEEKIADFEKEELAISLARSTIFTFTEPRSGKLLALLRVFDGSHLQFQNQANLVRYEKDDSRLPVQHMFSAVKIPELENSQYVLEIGRVLATKDLKASSYDTMMARVADYFNQRGMKGVIYLSSAPAMARYNTKKGAEVVYTPEQLMENNGDSISVLKIAITDFIKQFLQPEYNSVQVCRALQKDLCKVKKVGP